MGRRGGVGLTLKLLSAVLYALWGMPKACDVMSLGYVNCLDNQLVQQEKILECASNK